MKLLQAIQELFQIVNDLLGDRISNKANKNWKNDIETYDKITYRLFTIERHIKALEIIKSKEILSLDTTISAHWLDSVLSSESAKNKPTHPTARVTARAIRLLYFFFKKFIISVIPHYFPRNNYLLAGFCV